jgi:transposase
MHAIDTKSRFIELRAQGWSLARIATHLEVSKRTLVDWNQHSQAEIRLLKAVELEALHEKLLASHEVELTQLTGHLQRIEAELAKRELGFVSTENLYRLASQLRLQLQKVRGWPALPGEANSPAALSPATSPAT